METTKTRIYQLDEDSIEIVYQYDEKSKMYFGEYPDFSETPRYTPNGRPWVNVTHDGCPYADVLYDDCGSCEHIVKEKEGDLIGICDYAPMCK